MTDWSDGYVADVAYTANFYRETMPLHIAFAALTAGRNPGSMLQPRRVLDLGFGMGFGFVVAAASNPDVHFEGIDFIPLHVANAQGLADEAQLTNVSIREASFQDLAREAHEGQHDVDLIVLHGIFSWVTDEARNAIVEIARKRLKPGGLLYVSYNSLPGTASTLAMRHLLSETARRTVGRSAEKVDAGIALVQTLRGEGAKALNAIDGLEGVIAALGKRDKAYLAHEYLNADWKPFHFSEVAKAFEGAKLDFVASATLLENVERFSIPETMRNRITAERDRVFKETLRDIAVNKQFRRDVFGRGSAELVPADQIARLDGICFILAVPRSTATNKIQTLLGDVSIKSEICEKIFDLTSEEPVSFPNLCEIFGRGGFATALDTLGLLVHSGQVLPTRSGLSNGAIEDAPAHRFNAAVVKLALRGRTHGYLASPVLGTGIRASSRDLLLASAVTAGECQTIDAAANHVLQTMRRRGMDWVKDDQKVTDPQMLEQIVRESVEQFLSERLPLWRRLKVF